MEDGTNTKGEMTDVERQKIAELIQTTHVKKKSWFWWKKMEQANY